jgi:hypothetical protein
MRNMWSWKRLSLVTMTGLLQTERGFIYNRPSSAVLFKITAHKRLPTDGASTWSWWWELCVPMTQRDMPAVA